MDHHLPQLAGNTREELLDRLKKAQETAEARKEKNYTAIGVFLFFLICLISFSFNQTEWVKESLVRFVTISLVLTFLIYLAFWRKKSGPIRQFKNEVIKIIIKHLIPEITYQPSDNLSASNLRGARLFKYKSEKARGEDLFTGKRGNTSFRFSEIKTKLDDQYTFKGILIKCFGDFPIKKSIRIYSRDAKHIYSSKNMSMIDLSKSYPHFNKAFKVIGYSEENYINIINDRVLSQLQDIKQAFNGPIYISLFPKSAHIAIETPHNYFEPNLKKELNLDQVTRIYNQIIQCLLAVDIIDEISTGVNSENKRLRD